MRTFIDLSTVTTGMSHGDEQAFREFYSVYFSRLLRYLLVVTRGEEDLARDCLQEAMMRVIKNIKPFQDEAVFWGWLTRVARTAFLDEMRRRKRRANIAADMELCTTSPHSDDGMLMLINETIEELDDRDKHLIVGSYFDGRSHAALAEDQGTTPKAVESRIARIRKKLRGRILEKLKHE